MRNMGSLSKLADGFMERFRARISIFLSCFLERKRREMVILPDDVIIQILAALPVKSIGRFKAVSKSWKSLLSSYYFALTHCSLSTSQALCLLLQGPYNDQEMFYASAENFNEFCLCSSKKTGFQHQGLKWVACHNGIVCCLVISKTEGSLFFIGNPLTQREFVALPKLKFQVRYSFGFYFDTINQKFKILAITGSEIGTYLIFDSSIGEWGFPRNQPPYDKYCRGWVLSVGSACYVYSPYTLYTQGIDHLMCFDMEREEWEIIHTPIWLTSSCSYEIQERDGRLCIIQVTLDEIAQAHIWVLLQEKKWVHLMKIDLGQFGFHKLKQLGVAFEELCIRPEFLIGHTFLLNILTIGDHSELVPSWREQVGSWIVAYNRRSRKLGKMVQNARTRFFMYQPTLFTCKMEKDGKIHLG
ncbi:hypothetical protein AMTRI_Chr11g100480 [Amborella trichopoda]